MLHRNWTQCQVSECKQHQQQQQQQPPRLEWVEWKRKWSSSWRRRRRRSGREGKRRDASMEARHVVAAVAKPLVTRVDEDSGQCIGKTLRLSLEKVSGYLLRQGVSRYHFTALLSAFYSSSASRRKGAISSTSCSLLCRKSLIILIIYGGRG